MLWFYTRDRHSLTVETRYNNDALEYVVTVIGAAPVPETRRFATREAFRAWLISLEEKLAAGRWESEGAPHVLPDGWPDSVPLM